MSGVFRGKDHYSFTSINNEVLNAGLSWDALGLLCYVLSKPQNWQVSTRQLVSQVAKADHPTGRDATQRILNELIKHGFVLRTVSRGEGGKLVGWDYTFFGFRQHPDAQEAPEPALPATAEPAPANPVSIQTNEFKEKIERAQSPQPPAGGDADKPKKRSKATTLQAFLDQCKADGVKPIPESDPVFDYATRCGIPLEYISLNWKEFKSKYTRPDAKKYSAWRTVFYKTVTESWYGLWYCAPDGSCKLTSKGEQAKRFHGEQI